MFWNKYRSETTKQSRNINLDYMIIPTFRNVNSLFVFSFKAGEINPARNSCELMHQLKVSIKNQPVTSKQEACEKLVEMLKNNHHTTGNLLDYLYHQDYYKLIAIDLLKQSNKTVP